LIEGFAAVKRLAKFSPYVAGAELTIADSMFYFAADLAASVAQKLFEMPLLDELSGARDLLARLNDNPHIQMLKAKRDASMPAFIAAARAKMAPKG
jgi:glutathione S-transferase